MIPVYVHIMNEEAVSGELDEFPDPTVQFLTIRNPRRKDNKDLHYLDEGVSTMLVAWHRVTFVQVLPTETNDDVISFVRE